VRTRPDAERLRGGRAVPLAEVAERTGLPREEARALLHDLVTEERLLTETPDPGPVDGPGSGPRYRSKARL
jgi:hypothetical protein